MGRIPEKNQRPSLANRHFKRRLGSYRAGGAQAGKLIASAKIITKDLPIGKKYFYCARGPVLASEADKQEAVKLLFGEIKRLAKQAGAMFLRFDPMIKHQLPSFAKASEQKRITVQKL